MDVSIEDKGQQLLSKRSVFPEVSPVLEKESLHSLLYSPRVL
jgi:hypothetical protein